MVLTQRLKRRNQSDSVLSDTHHDENPDTSQTIQDIKEEVKHKLEIKKAKVSGFNPRTSPVKLSLLDRQDHVRHFYATRRFLFPLGLFREHTFSFYEVLFS